MRKSEKIIAGIAMVAILTTAGIIFFSVKKDKKQKMLSEVSDAGYETAYDILFPLRNARFKKAFF
jgi:hypothetical protein